MKQPYISYLLIVLRKGCTEPEQHNFSTHQSAYDCAQSITRQNIVWLELIGLHYREGVIRLMFYVNPDCW